MARIQLVLSDEDRDRFIHEAHREGVSLSEWLRLAAKDRVHRRMARRSFEAPREVTAFFEQCDALPGAESEPEWEEHLSNIEQSRRRGMSDS